MGYNFTSYNNVFIFCFVSVNFVFRQPEVINGALINGLEARVSVIEEKMSDIDARTSEEADNSLNERELDRFIMSGSYVIDHLIVNIVGLTFADVWRF